MADDEAALYDFCIELHRNRSVNDVTYDRALATRGPVGATPQTWGSLSYAAYIEQKRLSS
jgi:hypothetical protein